MAGSLPRVKCPACGGKVAGQDTRRAGIVSVVDHKQQRRDLVLCAGSMQHVPLPHATAIQPVLPGFDQLHLFGRTALTA